MSTKTLSPGAHLLRHSRLFSLPAPLSKPETLQTAAGTFSSDTATLPYPTLAAITTPPSSLARGDWGLKRPLPLRSTTATSTPVIRIGAVDNIAHITDFASAADHAITLKKWQELSLPISEAESISRRASVDSHDLFNWDHDRTSVAGVGSRAAARRWRFGGPWLVGQTELEFRRYLRKAISGREQEFREYLRPILHQKKVGDARLAAQGQGLVNERAHPGTSASSHPARPTEPVTLSDEELDGEIRELRRLGAANKLFQYLHAFLDLPVAETREAGQTGAGDLGPPKTHPSAGLSYLRTSSTLTNDPQKGPQATAPLVEARVLTPQLNGQNLMQRPMLGVAGIATGRVKNMKMNVQRARDQRDGSPLLAMDASTHGGGKCLVTPTRASVDSQGRICLHVDLPEQDSPGTRPKPPPAGGYGSVSSIATARRSPSATSSATTTTSGAAFGYGTASFPRASASTGGTSTVRHPFDARPTSPAGGMADVLEGA